MKDIIIVAGGDTGRRLQLTNVLNSEQHSIAACGSSEDFSSKISQENIAAVILLYPDESGIIGQLFDQNRISDCDGKIPVIFVSSSPGENNRLRSLRYTADEFLIEPISPGDISIVIDQTKLSRQSDTRGVLTIGDIVLDRASLAVTLRNMKLPLHPLQVRILEFLMLSPGRTFSRQEILDSIWSSDLSIEDRTVDVAIGRIRDAMRNKVTVDPIRTVRSVGYAFNEYFGQKTSLPRKGRGIRRPKRLRPVAAGH